MACLQASLNQGTLGSLSLQRWDLGMVLFAISVKTSVNWTTGSSSKTNPSDDSDIHGVRNDSQSALSNFLCSAEGSSFYKMFSESLGCDHFQRHPKCEYCTPLSADNDLAYNSGNKWPTPSVNTVHLCLQTTIWPTAPAINAPRQVLILHTFVCRQQSGLQLRQWMPHLKSLYCMSLRADNNLVCIVYNKYLTPSINTVYLCVQATTWTTATAIRSQLRMLTMISSNLQIVLSIIRLASGSTNALSLIPTATILRLLLGSGWVLPLSGVQISCHGQSTAPSSSIKSDRFSLESDGRVCVLHLKLLFCWNF